MAVLWINEQQVQERLSMEAVLDAVERAFQHWADGRADNGPRRRVRAPGAVLHSMAATAEYLGLAGWKQYLTTRFGAEFLVGLYRLDTGRLAALIEACRLGQLRTGAATAVALKYLAPAPVEKLAIVGTGYQAQTQLLGAAFVCRPEAIAIYSRDAERREAFARWARQTLNVEVIASNSAAAAVADASVIITATTSRTPVIEERMLPRTTIIVAMGSNWADKSELEIDTVKNSDWIVCDSVEACRLEAGELIQAAEQNAFDWQRAVELRDVVSGRVTIPHEGRILFKSVGLALEDVAAGALLLSEAPPVNGPTAAVSPSDR
ncbi:MAG: ornithine cyclodeaminase [Pirellulaceae bacterium]|nr:MAG: ornithine cyclodeaminase [Pirellulaceae bacterium]